MDMDCSRGAGGSVAAAPLRIEKLRHWCAAAEAGLSETFGRDHDVIVQGVEAGTLELYRLFEGEAWMVTRCENRVLIVCCYQGARLEEAAAWLHAQAVARGLVGIRFYTARPALVRLLSDYDFRPEVTAYYLELVQYERRQ